MDFLIPIIAVIILLLIAASKRGDQLRISDSARLTPIATNLSPDEAFDVVLEFAENNGYTVDNADQDERSIVLNQSASVLSYGAFFPIQIRARADGKTIVEIGAKAKMGSQKQRNFVLSKDHEKCVNGIRSHLTAAE